MAKDTSRKATTKKRATRRKKAATAPAAPAAKPRSSSAAELTRLVHQLIRERQHHVASIAEIDQTFKEFGLTVPEVKRRGRKPGSVNAVAATAGKPGKRGKRRGRKPGPKPKAKTGAPRGKRRTFGVTGDELILAFVKDKNGATTEEIRKHWDTSGRKGKAENNLTNLVKSGKLKRTKLDNKPGSTYSIP